MVAVAAVGLAALAAFALGGNTDSLNDQATNVPVLALQSEPSASPGPVEPSPPPATTRPVVPAIANPPGDGSSAVSNAGPGPANTAANHVKHSHHHGHHKHHHKHGHGHGG